MSEMLTLTQVPVFPNVTHASRDEALAARSGDIRIEHDQKTGVLRNVAFDPGLIRFDERYQNEQGHSEAFRTHLLRVRDIVIQRLGKKNLVEIGCGKGFFLKSLRDAAVDVVGFDPAYEGDSPFVRREYFEPGVIRNVEGFILRHVLEYFPDPFAFLEQLSRLNERRGKLLIEVADFEWVLRSRSWHSLFYEYPIYFRSSDFNVFFGDDCFIERGFGNQYIVVVGDLGATFNKRNDAQVWSDSEILEPVLDLPVSLKDKRIVVWGASSRGVMFSLLAQRQGCNIIGAIDINPAKQNRYMPGSGIFISDVVEGMRLLREDVSVVVTNRNYLSEVMQLVGKRCDVVPV